MENIKPKLRVDINKNDTKKGIKVQFQLPNNIDPNQKEEMTAKLQTKLNQALLQYNLSVSVDTDTFYDNIIGFFIRIQDIKQLILKALKGVNNNEIPPPPTV